MSGAPGTLRGVFAFVVVALRRYTGAPSALFFSLALPVVVITIIGSTFGGQARIEVGVAGDASGASAARIVEALEQTEGVEVRRFDDVDALRRAARRNAVGAGIVVPARLDAAVAAGGTVAVPLVLAPDAQRAFAARTALQTALDRAGAPLAAAAFAPEDGFAAALARADALDAATPADAGPEVRVVGEAGPGADDAFALVAPQNLVLFVFLTGLSTAGLVVHARRNGILRRVVATPHGAGIVVVGLAIGWVVVALAQSALIVLVGAVAFGVGWGDPLAATLLVLVFAPVGCAAGLVVGALGKDQDRVDSILPIAGIVLGALGGCMVPLEVFPPGLARVADLTPHAWAVRAWQTLAIDGGDVGDIAPSLAVLTGAAVALLALGAALLRRDLLR